MPHLSRKELEKQARSQLILKAARELFVLKGYHETTLDEIAHHAEFGKGTIYNYFSSKDELFFAILAQILDEISALVQSSLTEGSGSARDAFRNYARGMIAYARDNMALTHLIVHEIHRLNPDQRQNQMRQFSAHLLQVSRNMSGLLQKEQQAEKLKSFDTLSLAILFQGMVQSYCANQYGPFRTLKPLAIDEAADLITTLFFDGINDKHNKG